MTSSEVEFCLSKRGKDVHLLKRCQITRRNVIGPFSPKGPSRNKRYDLGAGGLTGSNLSIPRIEVRLCYIPPSL
ncbi:hypothetical protein HanXRQr2_Chr06g0263851 [Helianthus annuus]|uniref:Uncharacterized protein n=1 Tax=Helianthus annuus TaxID=4232 RepID=A0A251UIS5_HELAN|nr:hypothetical protein HanXRQr2_Chr06g0263851 [Helianthus annuus]KAJ0915841.1 hypothetical protein HanPSC8_Chr06g0254501 [Helianthus annuus]